MYQTELSANTYILLKLIELKQKMCQLLQISLIRLKIIQTQ